MNLLDASGLKVSYGGINAVKGINLNIRSGELVALIGANGAGKTTTLKAISGMLRPSAGKVFYDGADVTGTTAHQLVRKGLALVPEGRGVFSRLTVEENLQMGAYIRNDKGQIKQDLDRVYDLFERVYERRAQKAGTLSGGEQQMVAIGRALMSRPRLLLLDEPSMGLSPIMVQKIFEVVQKISVEGVTVLLVEQNAKRALEVSRRGYVMDSGRITLSDSAAALLNNPQVRAAYLGE
jgi:branched-chain amino acid transport system ATP-binding protein